METHHNPRVHHSKKWKDYLFEFFMLFLAVSAGFFMENQREHYVERLRVKQFAKSLISDLKKDTAMVNLELWEFRRVTSLIDSFLIYIDGKEIKEVNNIDFLYKSNFWLNRPYTWSRATIDQIKNSGSLRYFSNDSIVFKITAYDAFTRHMDEDYTVDLLQKSKITEKREQIADMNYPDVFLELLNRNYDSLKTTAYFEAMRKLDKQLIAKEISDIKIFANQSINLKFLLNIRMNKELPNLIKDAVQLIDLLEKEYHLY